MEKKYVVGVDLGGTKIYTALVDLEGNVKNEIVIKTEADQGEIAVLNKILNTIDTVLNNVDINEVCSYRCRITRSIRCRKWTNSVHA